LPVRNTKNKKERLVPIIDKALEHIKTYLDEARYWFTLDHKQTSYKDRINSNPTQALILNQKGTRLTTGYYNRLWLLQERAGITTKVNPHILRHSIATHLLAKGMQLEDIKDFLGHSSLESTQIYTHIAHNYEELSELA